jgi:Raf kinase inhibitor-like YbhB/YbcL family protein
LREALPPLRGAKIVGFTSTKPNSYKLTYDINGRKGYVSYTIAATGSVEFTFTDPSGKSTTENYTPRGQGDGGGRRPPRGPGDTPPPRSPGESQLPRGGQRPPPGEQPSDSKSNSNLPQLAVSSSALDSEGFISAEFTCDGTSASPPVEWKGAPEKTKFFALSLWHLAPDKEKSYWVIYNIPAKTTKIPKNARGIGTMGLNDRREQAYDPMCSQGPGVKEYHITVYALSAEAQLSPDNAARADLLEAIKDVTIAEGTLDFKYQRQQQGGAGGRPMGSPGQPPMNRTRRPTRK